MKEIHPRKSDSGLTRLADGTLIEKSDLRVEAYGSVDEMDCFAGLARVEVIASLPESASRDLLVRSLDAVQNAAWVLGTALSSPGAGTPDAARAVTGEIQELIALVEAEVGPIARFVIPGTTRAEAALHVARAACRRAERRAVALAGAGGWADRVPAGREGDAPWECLLLNRMSRLLFAMARLALTCGGAKPRYRGAD